LWYSLFMTGSSGNHASSTDLIRIPTPFDTGYCQVLTGQVLPPIDYEHIEPAPGLPADASEREACLGRLGQLAMLIDSEATVKNLREIANSDPPWETEKLASQVNLLAFAGPSGLLAHIDQETSLDKAGSSDLVDRNKVQRIIERILIASGPARVTVAFSPDSEHAVSPDTRRSLVGKLGYEPLTTSLADTTEYEEKVRSIAIRGSQS
jgi:hypothetical protein